MAFEVLETDKSFKDSPDAGDPKCICSRCNAKITEEEAPIIRCFTDDNQEYRYCDKCAWSA